MRKTLLTKLALLLVMLVGVGSLSAATVTDALNRELTGIANGGSYSAWSGKTSKSDAVYAGQSAGGSDCIQLRSNNSNSGVITTASGGTVKNITVSWEAGTMDGRTLNVYGKNTAYSAATDLYDSSKQGTLIGTIVKGTSTSLTINDTYEYIGFRSASGALYLSEVDIVWEISSATATTVTIDDSGITNTDVYTSTDAGSLSAAVTVTEGGAAVSGATVTWSSSDEDVATIASDGTVTLVAAGTTTITASYEGTTEYKSSFASYELNVTSSEPYVQPTVVEIVPNYSFWEQTATFSGSTYSELSGSIDNVSLEWSRGNGSTYANTSAMRFYKDNELTFTAPAGYQIKNIELDISGTYSDLTFSPAGFDSDTKTWSGDASTVTMSRPSNASSYATISKFIITIGQPSSIATPTFSVASGIYESAQEVTISCETDGATIYYTTDGTTPSASNGTQGTSVSITTTTTLKAIAIKGDESSAVASATYTIELPFTTIAAVKALASGATFKLNLTGAQVVYIDGEKKNIYVRDASGAIDLYNGSGFITSLQTGDILSGTIEGTYSPYKNLPEIKDITDISVLTATNNQTVVAKTIAGTTEAIAANLCDLVKIENTEITESSGKYYVGTNSDIQLYDNFSVGYTVNTDEAVDVSGIATVYNTTYELFPRFVEDIVYLDNSVAVSIGEAGMATFSSTKALDFTGVDAIAAYTAKATSDGKITFTRIYKVPANTGLLLRNALGETEGAVAAVNVPVATDATAVSDNNLIAVDTEIASLPSTDGTKANYILNKVNGNLGFYRAADHKVAAGKAYLQIDTSAARSFFAISFDNEATGISSVKVSHSMEQIYDLQGRYVAQPTKGLYIVNGKKVIIK